MRLLKDSLVIAERDIIRSFRQNSQLYSSIVRPLIWLFLLGNGLRGSFSGMPGGYNYMQYIFPGMLAMNILFAAMQSGTSIIWDREFGFLKEILVAPVYRISIVFGKILSGSVVATAQGLIVLALFPFLGLRLSILQIILTIAGMFFISIAVCSIGVLIATRMRSFEGFGTINNFIVMPLFFLSGAMYPIKNIPAWLKALVSLNPVTYGVNILRGIILKIPENYLLSIAVLFSFAAVFIAASAYLFSFEGRSK
jgi:ABC-2 type transport system permease protein